MRAGAGEGAREERYGDDGAGAWKNGVRNVLQKIVEPVKYTATFLRCIFTRCSIVCSSLVSQIETGHFRLTVFIWCSAAFAGSQLEMEHALIG